MEPEVGGLDRRRDRLPAPAEPHRDRQLRQQVGAKLLKRAKDSLSWEVIAEKTLEVYQQSTAKKALAKAS